MTWVEAILERSIATGRPALRQPREDALARLARHAADRRHLARLDDRLLADVGLTREAVRRGLPFRPERRDTSR
jgi:uncharacterized protein YjiS (DUF1127 family)